MNGMTQHTLHHWVGPQTKLNHPTSSAYWEAAFLGMTPHTAPSSGLPVARARVSPTQGLQAQALQLLWDSYLLRTPGCLGLGALQDFHHIQVPWFPQPHLPAGIRQAAQDEEFEEKFLCASLHLHPEVGLQHATETQSPHPPTSHGVQALTAEVTSKWTNMGFFW